MMLFSSIYPLYSNMSSLFVFENSSGVSQLTKPLIQDLFIHNSLPYPRYPNQNPSYPS